MKSTRFSPRRLRWLLIPFLLLASLMAYSSIFQGSPSTNGDRATSAIFRDGRFHNAVARKEFGLADGLKAMVRNVTDKSPQAAPDSPIDIAPLTREELTNAPDQSLWRLGHSTVLLKLDGKFWLTDPVFSERCGVRVGPVTIGLKRLVEPALALRHLPPVDLVLLSHAHTDHFDLPTLRAMENRRTRKRSAHRS